MKALLKYEFRKTWAAKAMVLGVTAVAELVFLAGLYIGKNENLTFTGIALLMICASVGIVTIGLQSVLVLHRDMNTKQGYMLYMTPNSCYKTLGAKVIENGLSLLLAGAFFFALASLDVTLLFTRYGQVSSVSVDMGPAALEPARVPCTLEGPRIVDRPVEIGGEAWNITCVSMGNPHCVVFTDRVAHLDLNAIGPHFENAPIFPQRVNAEFVHVVNPTTLRMRCFERGSGETMACGTGACAAVVAAVENGLCRKDVDVQVQVAGGNLLVRYTDDAVTLTGNVSLVYEGETLY